MATCGCVELRVGTGAFSKQIESKRSFLASKLLSPRDALQVQLPVHLRIIRNLSPGGVCQKHFASTFGCTPHFRAPIVAPAASKCTFMAAVTPRHVLDQYLIRHDRTWAHTQSKPAAIFDTPNSRFNFEATTRWLSVATDGYTTGLRTVRFQ